MGGSLNALASQALLEAALRASADYRRTGRRAGWRTTASRYHRSCGNRRRAPIEGEEAPREGPRHSTTVAHGEVHSVESARDHQTAPGS